MSDASGLTATLPGSLPIPGARARTLACACLLLLVSQTAARAQKLPSGEWRRDRERTYDIRHYRAELSLDPEAGTVAGRVSIEMVPLLPLESLSLDASELEVTSVHLGDGDVPLDFETGDGSLEISFPHVMEPVSTLPDSFVVTIEYRAAPKSGMFFQKDPAGSGLYFVYTYGEGGLHSNWLPIYTGVNDKFTSEMRITVPQPYVVISNGRLADRFEEPDGRLTYHWVQAKPHSDYLIALYVGDFERGSLKPAFGYIPLDYWVPRGRLAEGAYAFRNTTRMVEFFSNRFNYPYPWEKYDQIAVPDYAIGAMEHTGVTGHRASVLRLPGEAPLDFGGPDFNEYTTDWTAESTISHELAHHWFGDNLTCRDLSYIWLNESFASYLMMLWDEESVGRDQLLFDVELARRHYVRYVHTEHTIRPLEYHRFDAPDEIYNTEHTYLKGAAVLHMLRQVLGDEAFFKAMSYYLHEHEFGNVVSQDLKIAIEESTGKNLDWFFDQWVTGAGHPRFDVRVRYLADRKLVALDVEQVQALVEGQGLFKLPVAVTLATAEKTWTEKVWVEEDREHFYFDAAEKPLMVSFDGGGDLVAEIHFEKEPEELAYQAAHDALPGRMRALDQLVARFPAGGLTLRALDETLSEDAFWALKAEAAKLLGEIRTPAAGELVARALESPDYRVRKAAVLALASFPATAAKKTLVDVVASDAHSDVVGTALVALSRVDPEGDAAVFREALGRDSWYDEIRIAAVQAMGNLARKELVATIRPYAEWPYNQDLRAAALAAWEASDPADPDLHAALARMAQAPPYTLQQNAIQALGRLAADGAKDVLETLAEGGDPNLAVLAKKALKEIRRAAEAGQ